MRVFEVPILFALFVNLMHIGQISCTSGSMDRYDTGDFWWNLAPLGCVFAALLCLVVICSRLRLREQPKVVL